MQQQPPTDHALLPLPSAAFHLGTLDIAPTATREEWQDIHRSILLCKSSASRWLKQSRDWATERFGIDFVAETEVQLELQLGLQLPEEKPQLNPADKTRGILTIEGIATKFQLWQRKMSEDFAAWDSTQLTKAIELLEPIERQTKALRDLLEKKK